MSVKNSFINYQKNNPLTMIIVLMITFLAGFLYGKYAPRGPLTTQQVLILLAVSLLTGLVSGFFADSRVVRIITPVAIWAAFEVSRMGTVGPTVDRLNLATTYGVIAFFLGRVIPFLLMLLPVFVGIQSGRLLNNILSHDRQENVTSLSWILTISGIVLVVYIAVLLLRKPATAPILDQNGGPLHGSIAEIVSPNIGGHDQAIMIRGKNTQLPVLLFLAGGPGGTELGTMRNDVSLEDHFIVATWEQRGVGKSYPALDPVHTLTLDQMIADTHEVTRYLMDRFDEEKIYLAGNSWGTLLGVLAVQENPELYHAFIAAGQMVSVRETDIMFYEDTLQWAREAGNNTLVRKLEVIGPPPYDDLLNYEHAVGHEHDWNPYPYLNLSLEMPSNLLVPENTLIDKINGLRSFLDTFSVLYLQIQDVDLREDVANFPVPLYLALGKYESRGRSVLAVEWFNMVDAPNKEMILFEKSGHRPIFEEPGKFSELMQEIQEETYYEGN